MNDLVVKNVDLFGDSIVAAKDKDGNIWAGVRWFCYGLGMSEGQMKRQIMNIKEDTILSKGGSKFILPTGNSEQEVFCLRIDYLPLWLTRISITPTMKKEHPDLASKLLEYQLKAKDVLAEAFITKKQNTPMTIPEQIQVIAQGHVELKAEIDSVKKDLEDFKNDMPILGIEETKISNAVRKKGIECLGGKESNAYNDRSVRGRLYSDLHNQLRREFDVSTYKAIKRNQTDTAIKIIQRYVPPLVLSETIETMNAQQKLDV